MRGRLADLLAAAVILAVSVAAAAATNLAASLHLIGAMP